MNRSALHFLAVVPLLLLVPACGGTASDSDAVDSKVVASRALATVPFEISAMVSDGTSLYYVGKQNSLQRIAVTGGEPDSFFASEGGGVALALDTANIYVLNDAGVFAIDKVTQARRKLGETKCPESLAVDAERVYWTNTCADSHHGEIRWAPKSGSEGWSLFTETASTYHQALAVDDAAVYFADADAILRQPKTAKALPVVLNRQRFLNGPLTVKDGYIYFVASNGAGIENLVLSRIPTSGSPSATTVATGVHPLAFAADDSRLFWLNDSANGYVGYANLAAASAAHPTAFAIARQSKAMTIDATKVYWSTHATTPTGWEIRSTPKPADAAPVP
jgi:hypothetical protein